MRSLRRACLLAAALALGAAAAAQPGTGGDTPRPDDAARRRVAHQLLADARAQLRADRAEAAEQTARRALALAPDDAAVHVFLARVLEQRGRAEAAAVHRARADALDPPPAPPPDAPLAVPTRGIAVALLPPAPGDEPAARVADDWPAGPVAAGLAERLERRLPGAAVRHADPATLAEARAWLARHGPRGALSLRVVRAYCEDTIKDGRFAVAQLRVAAEAPAAADADPGETRLVLRDPRGPGDCRSEVLARALERALARDDVRRVLQREAADGAAYARPAVRALFPGLGERIAAQLDAGRAQLAEGHVDRALEAFREAAAVDPGDPEVLAYLDEARKTRALDREIEAQRRDARAPAPARR